MYFETTLLCVKQNDCLITQISILKTRPCSAHDVRICFEFKSEKEKPKFFPKRTITIH